jgi:hypothetical protein
MTDVMMQMMLGGQQAGITASSLPDLLATIAQRNPRMQPLVQHFQARIAAKENTAETVAEEAEAIPAQEPEIVESVDPNRREQKLKKLTRTMFVEMQALRSRNAMLADALGACHLCWGDDPACAYCAGQGSIGAYLIDPAVFEDVIGPAMRQVLQRPSLAKTQTTNKGERNHAGL